MDATIPGIHHVTAISGAAQQNVDFYTGVLGFRLVKTTVNFDDPTTYHLYYGDTTGQPGTILTFFPWANAVPGRPGAGQAHGVAFAVPAASVDAWHDRLSDAGVDAERSERFGETVLTFTAPDGLPLEIEGTDAVDGSDATDVWTAHVPAPHAIRGFHGTSLPALSLARTADLLTNVFGWTRTGESDGRIRFSAPGDAIGRHLDLVTQPAVGAGRMGQGTIHHVALRARDANEQADWQRALRDRGITVTDVKDRQYFQSIYFRDAEWTSGVLFEIATDAPGFLHDESRDALGTALKLPSWLEVRRDELQDALPPLTRPATRTPKP